MTSGALSARTLARSRDRAFDIGERIAREPNVSQRGLAGNAGDALLFLALLLATGEQAYEARMHDALKRAATGEFPNSPGVFSGTSGLRAVAALATVVEPRYAALVRQCDAYVDSTLPGEPAQPENYLRFDVVEGWAGQRLARCVDGPRPVDRLSELLAWLLEDERRTYCPHPSDASRVPVRDAGTAHGLAGILATMALTHEDLDSLIVEHVHRAATELVSYAVDGPGFPTWPHSIGRAYDDRFQSAWCYGTPGVTNALYAASRMCEDEVLGRFAVGAACAMAARLPEDWLISQIGICHGIIGNALCFASLAAASSSAQLASSIEPLVVRALDALDASDGKCYSSDERGPYEATNEITGVAGIALGLLTLAGSVPGDWMRLHALRPL